MADFDNKNIPEGVEVTPEGVINCTREALNKLGDWCRKNAGALAISVFAATSTNAVLAQSLTPNPEYDRIIAEAQKQGKDPVDYAMELKGGGRMTFSQQREFNKYYKDKAVIAKKDEGKELDKAVIASTKSLDETSNQLVRSYWQLLTIFEGLLNKNKITSVESQKITGIYKDPVTPPEMKKYIENKFGKYLERDKVAQL